MTDSEYCTVDTSNGPVRGYGRRGVIKFKGIPYAASPVGDLRFQPPAPVAPWAEVRDALAYGPIAPQPPSELEAMFGEAKPMDEAGCLTLNIWTQAIDNKKRPVMFWIHGGGFITGSGAAYDGARLVLRGDVVMVSINYRLGALGFLHFSDTPDASSNVGLLDMVAALKFVKENIANFGGDPDNITIFGESAGGFAVASLLAMPVAKGLFHRAIPQSGAAHPQGFKAEAALKVNDELSTKLGIETNSIKSLRQQSFQEIIDAQTAITARDPNALTLGALRFGPVVDGDSLPHHPLAAVKNGFAKEIDLFLGTNRDETKLWNMWNPKADELDESLLVKAARQHAEMVGKEAATAQKLIDAYRTLRKTPRNILDAISTDYRFRIPSVRLAEAQSQHQPNTYMYLFEWPSPMKGGKFGAMHALELAFVFGTLLPKDIGIFPKRTEETEALSAAMMDTWIAFARSGNPNNESIPGLAAYSIETRSTIIFDKKIAIQNDPYGEETAVWADLL